MPLSGAELATRALHETLLSSRCPHCGKIPKSEIPWIAHGHDGESFSFCPAFATFAAAGRWIDFNTFIRSLRRHSPYYISTYEAGKIEDHDQRFGEHHPVMGIAAEGTYIIRSDAPALPEFSVFYPYRGRHTVVYRGWRYLKNQISDKLKIRWSDVASDLGIPPDRSTEEIRRLELGWL